MNDGTENNEQAPPAPEAEASVTHTDEVAGEETTGEVASADAPGHTDLMVAPEVIDEVIENDEELSVTDEVAFQFKPNEDLDYCNHPEVAYVGTEEGLAQVANGAKFFAGYLHDPAKSTDHYDYMNYREALITGKVSRKGLPKAYWRDAAMKRPPVMQKAGKGAIFVA